METRTARPNAAGALAPVLKFTGSQAPARAAIRAIGFPPIQSLVYAYIEMFRTEQQSIVNALLAIGDCESGATVVHCHVGKDRTGLVCAVLALLLDLPTDDMVTDYVLSGQGVSDSVIGRFIDWFVQSDAQNDLARTGIGNEQVQRLKARLLTS